VTKRRDPVLQCQRKDNGTYKKHSRQPAIYSPTRIKQQDQVVHAKDARNESQWEVGNGDLSRHTNVLVLLNTNNRANTFSQPVTLLNTLLDRYVCVTKVVLSLIKLFNHQLFLLLYVAVAKVVAYQ